MSFTIVSVDVPTGTVTTNHPGGGAVYVSTFVSINGVVGRDGGGGYGEYASGGMAQTAVYPTLIGGYNTTIFLLDANVYLDGDGVNPPGTIIPLSAPFTIGPAPVLDNTAVVITNITPANQYYNVPSYPLAFNYKIAKVLTDACGNETVSVIPNANTHTNTSRGNNKTKELFGSDFDAINGGDTIVFVSASNPTLELSNHFTVLPIIDTTAVNILTNQFTINASNYDATAVVYLSINGMPYINNTFTINHVNNNSNQVIDVSELTGVSLLGGSDVITIDLCGSGLTLKTLSMLVPLEIAAGILGPSITNNTSNNISAYLYYAVYDPLYTLRSNAESHIDSSAILTTAVELVPGLTHYMWSDVGLTDPIHSDMKFKLILADGTNRVGSPLSGSINTAPERPTLYAAQNDITINSFDLSSDIINLTASKDLIQLYFKLFPVRTVQGFEAEDLCGQGQTFTVPVSTSDINFYTITGRHLNDWGGYRVYIMGLPRHPELIGISGSGAPGVVYATNSYPAEIPEPTITIVSADSGTGEMVVQSSGGFRFCRVLPANQFVQLGNPLLDGTAWNTTNRFSVVAGLNTINYVDLLDAVLDFSLYVMIVTSDGMNSQLTTPHDLEPPPTPTPTQVTINSFDICNNTITMTSTYGGGFPAKLECEFTNSAGTDISFNGSPIFTLFNGTRTYNFFDMILQDEINDTTLRYLADKKVRVSSARGWGNLTLRDHGAKYVSVQATAPSYPTLGAAYVQSTTANNKIVIVSTYATPFTAYLDNSGGSTGLDNRRSPIMTINPGTNTITNTYQRMDVGTHFKLRAMLGWGDQYVDNPFTVTVQGSLPDQPVHIDALGDDENSIVVVSAYRFERAYLRITNDGSAAVSYNIDPSSIFTVPENPTAGQPGNGTFDFVGTLLTLTGIEKLIDSRSSTIAVYDADSNRRISGIFRRSGLSQRSVVPPIAGDIRITNVDRTGITFDSSNNIQGVLLTVNGTPIQPAELESIGGTSLFINWGHNQFGSHTFTTSAIVQFIRPVEGGSAVQLSNAYNFVLGSENVGVATMTSATAQSGNVVFTSTKAVSGVQFATRSPSNINTVRPGSFAITQGTNTIAYTSKVSDGSSLTDLSGHLMTLVLAENNSALVSANTTTVAGLPVNQIITPVNPTVSTTLGALVSAPGSVSASDIQAAVQASPSNIQVANDTTAVSAVGDRTLMNQRNNPNNVIVASQDGTLKLRSINVASAAAKDVSVAVKKVDTQTFNINLTKIDASGEKVSSTIGDVSTYDTLVVEIPTPPSLVLTINHVDNSGTVTPLFTGIDLGALANNGTYTNPSNGVSIQRLFANTSGATIKYSITGPFSEQNQIFTTTTITDAVLSTNVITYNATGDVSGAVQFAVDGTVISGSSSFTVAVGDNQTINFQGLTGTNLGAYAGQSLTMVMVGSGGTLTSAAYTIPSLPVALTSTSFAIENFDLSNNTFQITSSPLVEYDISAYIMSDDGPSESFNIPRFTSPYTVNYGSIAYDAPSVASKTLTLFATAAFGGIAISPYAIAPAFPTDGDVVLNSYNVMTNVLNLTSTYASTFTGILVDGISNSSSGVLTIPVGTTNIQVDGVSFVALGASLTMSATSSYGSAVVSNTLTVSPPPAPEPLTSSSFTISHIDISNNTFRITPVSSVVYDVSAVINVVVSESPPILLPSSAFNIAAFPATTTINYGTIMGGNAKIAGKKFQLYATEAFGSMAISAQATAPNYPGSSAVTLNSYNVSTNVLSVNSMYGTSFTAVLFDASSNTTSAPFTVSTSMITAANITVSGLSLASTGGVLTMYATASYNSGVVSNTLTVSAVASPPAPAPPSNDASGNVICVCAGTMIMTPTGERAVESLSAGDLIVASDGRKLPIVSLHYTEVASCNAKNAPYVIKAGAFGKGLPHTDLAVSPLHALEVSKGKWMIPSMTTDPALRSKMARYAEGQATTYYHLELANYLTDNFIANGVVSESNGLPWQLRNAVPMKVYSQMRNGYMTRASAAPATVQKTKAANKASR